MFIVSYPFVYIITWMFLFVIDPNNIVSDRS